MPTPRPEVSEVVESAIRRAFGEKADAILKSMTWDSICGCWMFQFAGMVVGCELDGYIHS